MEIALIAFGVVAALVAVIIGIAVYVVFWRDRDAPDKGLRPINQSRPKPHRRRSPSRTTGRR